MLHRRNRTNQERYGLIGEAPTRPTETATPRMRQLEVTAAANRTARTIDALSTRAARGSNGRPPATIAALIGNATGKDWQAFVTDRICAWAEGYFDEAGAGARSPWRGLSPYAAWRGEAELDRTPEILGVDGFCGIARTLPHDAGALLLRVAHDLELGGERFEAYLLRLLETVTEWAGQALRYGRHGVSTGSTDIEVRELLAIRAAWDLALYDAFGTKHRGIVATLRQRLAPPLRRNDTGRECRHA